MLGVGHVLQKFGEGEVLVCISKSVPGRAKPTPCMETVDADDLPIDPMMHTDLCGEGFPSSTLCIRVLPPASTHS